jgi:hypothetical protein
MMTGVVVSCGDWEYSKDLLRSRRGLLVGLASKMSVRRDKRDKSEGTTKVRTMEEVLEVTMGVNNAGQEANRYTRCCEKFVRGGFSATAAKPQCAQESANHAYPGATLLSGSLRRAERIS